MPELGIWGAVAVLLAGAATIALAGPRMVRVADRLADETGMGEALVGAVLVGAATSLPDLLATITPALRGLPELAVGNALGGVLAQTAFLAVADLAYREANLEHAAASLPNLMQGSQLLLLLGGVVVLLHGPQVAVLGVHPGTLVLFAVYGFGLRVIHQAAEAPMWKAVATEDTLQDVPDEDPDDDRGLGRLWTSFGVLAALLTAAGIALARGGEALLEATGMSESAVGVLVTGVSSSLAELVVSIAAVRAGALTLAVGNVIGGNTFDTLMVGVADVAYREGSVYAAVGAEATTVTGISIVATAVLLLGLLRRQRHGVGNIGTESAVVLALYAFAIAVVL